MLTSSKNVITISALSQIFNSSDYDSIVFLYCSQCNYYYENDSIFIFCIFLPGKILVFLSFSLSPVDTSIFINWQVLCFSYSQFSDLVFLFGWGSHSGYQNSRLFLLLSLLLFFILFLSSNHVYLLIVLVLVLFSFHFCYHSMWLFTTINDTTTATK